MGLFKDCGCGCNGKKQEQKLLISITAALVFFIVASPDTFRLMRKLLGKWVANPNGCPTTSGLALHTVVYMLITWGMMNIKSEGYTAETVGPAPQDVVDEFEDEIGEEVEEVEEEVDVSELEFQAEDVSIDLKLSDTDTSDSMEPLAPPRMAPPRMADVPSPLPGMKEEPVGMFDSGAMYAPMDLGSEGDKPQASNLYTSLTSSNGWTMSNVNVSCADGSKPIVR